MEVQPKQDESTFTYQGYLKRFGKRNEQTPFDAEAEGQRIADEVMKSLRRHQHSEAQLANNK